MVGWESIGEEEPLVGCADRPAALLSAGWDDFMEELEVDLEVVGNSVCLSRLGFPSPRDVGVLRCTTAKAAQVGCY